MENRSHAIIAVGFLLVFALGAVVVYYWLADQHSEPLAYAIITDESVGGLGAQSPVRFKGLVVGHVSRVGFDPHDRSKVAIRLQLRPGTYVTRSTYAVVAMQGLTGGSALELKLGKGSRAPLPTSAAHPALIPLRPSLLASLEGSAGQDAADLHAVLGSARQMLGATNRAHLAATLAQLDTATRQLAALETQLGPALAQLPQLLQGLQRSVDAADGLLRQAQVPVRDAAAMEDSIRQLAASSRRLSDTLNRQTAPDADQLTRSLETTSRQLNALLRELRARPQSLIFGAPPHPPGPGEPGFKRDSKGGGQR